MPRKSQPGIDTSRTRPRERALRSDRVVPIFRANSDMTKELHCNRAAYDTLIRGGTPHVVFKSPVKYEVGELISVVELFDDGDLTRASTTAQVASVTPPGSPALPPDVGVVSISLSVPTEVGSRLFRTLRGHRLELEAAFARSATHKLPGSKGRLRERAVAQFLASWMPSRFRPFTNVFFSHDKAGLFDNEVDAVLYDAQEGAHWSLDGSQENWMLDWSHVRVAFEIKSTLDKDTWNSARKSIEAVVEYGKKASQDSDEPVQSPLTALIAYKIDLAFEFDFNLALGETHPFDLIVVLPDAAYLSARKISWADAFEQRLTPDDAQADLNVANKMLHRDVSPYDDGYTRIAKYPEEALMALIYVCMEQCAGSNMTLSLLSALGVAGKVEPLWDYDEIRRPIPEGEGTSESANPSEGDDPYTYLIGLIGENDDKPQPA